MIEVWQALNFLESITYDGYAHKFFPDAFQKVAEVDADNLADAFELTNTIHDVWWKNSGVTAVVSPCRSTSVGDVIVMNGQAYRVAGCGFDKI